MKKPTLTATTPHGVFTRATASPYTHIAVTSPRASYQRTYTGPEDLVSQWGARSFGVFARIVKDRGYVVTWHCSREAAEKRLAKGGNGYVRGESLGVFAVDEVQS